MHSAVLDIHREVSGGGEETSGYRSSALLSVLESMRFNILTSDLDG